MSLTLCPAKIAGITASQNRHQFDIVVTDLEAFVNQAIANGGKLMGEVQKDDTGKRIGLKDPDGNSMVIIEMNE